MIREFRETDRSTVRDLWAETELTRPWNDPDRDIDTCINSGHGALLVIETENRRENTICGTVMVGHDGHRGWVYYLAVAPGMHGTGLGKKLMVAAEDWVRARGIRKLELMVRTENRAVIDFYRAAGYEPADVVVLQRWLDGTII